VKKKILISTGGSGGHTIPAITLYEHLKNDFEIFLTSDKRGAKYINKNIYNYKLIEIPRISKNFFKFPYILLFLIVSFFKSFFFMKKNNIQILISTGGYMSLPLCLSAKMLKIKIYLFEPNILIGRLNKFFLKFSEKIISYSKNLKNFPEKYKHKIFFIDPLLRKKIYQEKKIFENKIKKPFTILIIGGSQGADFFDNEISELMIDLFKDYKISLIQQITDEKKKKIIEKKYIEIGIQNELFSFNEEIFQKYNQIDFAITRSGASTISELTFFNVPFLAIPLPESKDNHQFYNAKDYFDKKLCWLLNQSDYKKENLKEFILNLIQNPEDYFEKKNNMNKFSYQNTWNNINQKLLALINEN
jgi:UDP-N-acetylglucosamine--N-acetylmuramyl-(pentapeptide) pyrophosphoryl-undecaprenol N-acetylglucosamine transferase